MTEPTVTKEDVSAAFKAAWDVSLDDPAEFQRLWRVYTELKHEYQLQGLERRCYGYRPVTNHN